MENNFIIGVDFGSDSVRAVLVDPADGTEYAVSEFRYPRWSEGLYCDAGSSMFRQDPLDYIEGLEFVLGDIVSHCPAPERISAVGVDATSSTPCLVDKYCRPLSMTDGFSDNPDAMFVLWKDHTASVESEEITGMCTGSGLPYLDRCGGHYSSECCWSKVLHNLRHTPELRHSAYTVVELGDWIPAILSGCCDVSRMTVGKCAAGSKMMWSEEWGGYPPEEFFRRLDPSLATIAGNLPGNVRCSSSPCGFLCKEWAVRTGLKEGIVVGVGNIDAHSGAVGAGIAPGTMVLNLGTSACYMAVTHRGKVTEPVKGIFGQVEDSILPGMTGFESGLSAFGDIFAWLKRILCWPLRNLCPAGMTPEQLALAEGRLLSELGEQASRIVPDDSLPVATDHLNGRRNPFPAPDLKAAICGLSLSVTAPELYYSFAEAAAFATKAIVDYLESNDVKTDKFVAIGGIASKSPFVMQLLSDVTGRRIEVSGASQACALGAAVNAAVAAGFYDSVPDAQQAMCRNSIACYIPDRGKAGILERRYGKYTGISDFMRLP